MQTFDLQESPLSLVSWARTAQPARWTRSSTNSATRSGERPAAPVDATDDVLFGFSTATLLMTPLALLIVVVFG